jgi:hypothetical protein
MESPMPENERSKALIKHRAKDRVVRRLTVGLKDSVVKSLPIGVWWYQVK